MARGREPPAGDPAYPKRRERAPPGPPLVTLEQLREGGCWCWIVCRNPGCGRAVPIAIVPLIIRWGPLEEVDRLRRSAVCQDCGHRGASLSVRSWHGSEIGNAPWPARFVTDERGVAVEPNRPTHYHDGRPMEWWLRQQAGTRASADGSESRQPRGRTMTDDKTKRGGQDRNRINIHEDYEVRDWSKKLGVTHQQLMEAVQAVGDRAEDVERHLKGHGAG